jgi:hypothetical protein
VGLQLPDPQQVFEAHRKDSESPSSQSFLPAHARHSAWTAGLQRLRLERLLLLEERLLPRLEAEVLRLPSLRALARSLCARLFCALARPPLLAACARLDVLREGDERPEDEDEELRDAIVCAPCFDFDRGPRTMRGHSAESRTAHRCCCRCNPYVLVGAQPAQGSRGCAGRISARLRGAHQRKAARGASARGCAGRISATPRGLAHAPA